MENTSKSFRKKFTLAFFFVNLLGVFLFSLNYAKADTYQFINNSFDQWVNVRPGGWTFPSGETMSVRTPSASGILRSVQIPLTTFNSVTCSNIQIKLLTLSGDSGWSDTHNVTGTTTGTPTNDFSQGQIYTFSSFPNPINVQDIHNIEFQESGGVDCFPPGKIYVGATNLGSGLSALVIDGASTNIYPYWLVASDSDTGEAFVAVTTSDSCPSTSFTIVGVDFGQEACKLVRFLFVPNPGALNNLLGVQTSLSNRAPFSWFYQVKAALTGISVTTSSPGTLTISTGSGSAIPVSVEIFSESTLEHFTTSGSRAAIRTVMNAALYLAFITMVIFEVRHLFRGSPKQ